VGKRRVEKGTEKEEERRGDRGNGKGRKWTPKDLMK